MAASRHRQEKDARTALLLERLVPHLLGPDHPKSSPIFQQCLKNAGRQIMQHSFLDAEPPKVMRKMDAIEENLRVHLLTERAERLRSNVNIFLACPLDTTINPEVHHALLQLAFMLGNSPVNVPRSVLDVPSRQAEAQKELKELKEKEELKKMVTILQQSDSLVGINDWLSDMPPPRFGPKGSQRYVRQEGLSDDDEDFEEQEQAAGSASSEWNGKDDMDVEEQPGLPKEPEQHNFWSSDFIPVSSSSFSVLAPSIAAQQHHPPAMNQSYGTVMNVALEREAFDYLSTSSAVEIQKRIELSAPTVSSTLNSILLSPSTPAASFLQSDKPLDEVSAMKESLLALKGVSGSVFLFSVETQSFSLASGFTFPHCTPLASTSQLLEISSFATMLRFIRTFIDQIGGVSSIHQVLLPPSHQKLLYGFPVTNTHRSFVSSISSILSTFDTLLTKIENTVKQLPITHKKPLITSLISTLHRHGPKIRYLESVIHEVILTCRQACNSNITGPEHIFSLSSCTLLNIVHKNANDASSSSSSSSESMPVKLLMDTLKPYLDMMGQWVTEGQLNDPYNEFFILETVSSSSSLSIDADADSRLAWKEAASFRPNCTPIFLQPLAERIFLTGKSIRLVRRMKAEEDLGLDSAPAAASLSSLAFISPAMNPNIDADSDQEEDEYRTQNSNFTKSVFSSLHSLSASFPSSASGALPRFNPFEKQQEDTTTLLEKRRKSLESQQSHPKPPLALLPLPRAASSSVSASASPLSTYSSILSSSASHFQQQHQQQGVIFSYYPSPVSSTASAARTPSRRSQLIAAAAATTPVSSAAASSLLFKEDVTAPMDISSPFSQIPRTVSFVVPAKQQQLAAAQQPQDAEDAPIPELPSRQSILESILPSSEPSSLSRFFEDRWRTTKEAPLPPRSAIASSLAKPSLDSLISSPSPSLAAPASSSSSSLLPTVPLDYLLHRCLSEQIHVYDRVSCPAALSLLQSRYRLIEHLAVLRSFFFMEAGDALHYFCTQIFDKMDKGQHWEDFSELNSTFQESIQLAAQSPLSPLAAHILSVEPDDRLRSQLDAISRLNEEISELQDRGAASGDTESALRIKALLDERVRIERDWRTSDDSVRSIESKLKLNLNRLSFPLNIIITSESLKTYNTVFRLLLQIKRAKHCLESVGALKHRGRDTMYKQIGRDVSKPPPAILHRFYAFVSQLLAFINTLHEDIMFRILHTQWDSFIEKVSKSSDMDDLIDAHQEYLTKVLARCYMAPQFQVNGLASVILRVLDSCVAIRKRFLSYEADRMSAAASSGGGQAAVLLADRLFLAEVQKQRKEFERAAVLLLQVARTKMRLESHPYLEALLLRLDLNEYYATLR